MCRQEQPDNEAQHGEQDTCREHREPVFRGGSGEHEVREVYGDGEIDSGCTVRELREARGTKFYRLPPQGRLRVLMQEGVITAEDMQEIAGFTGLDADAARNLIENQIGQFALPMGIVRDLEVNGKIYQVPVVTEEPSVVAAASNGARIARVSGGVTAQAGSHCVTGEIIFSCGSGSGGVGVIDAGEGYAGSGANSCGAAGDARGGIEAARIARILEAHSDDIRTAADAAHPSIVGYGGGLLSHRVEILGGDVPAACSGPMPREDGRTGREGPADRKDPGGSLNGSRPGSGCRPSDCNSCRPYDRNSCRPERFVKLSLIIDPCDAMGANIVNTICEAVAAAAEGWMGCRALTAILSNNVPAASAATARVEVQPHTLATRSCGGELIARRIAELSALARIDTDRAVTHNKGIMNGISSAVLASGNDTRAVEAGAHAFAARTGRYMPLSEWALNSKGNLCGEIHIPLQVGIIGGAAGALPMARLAKRIGGYPSVQEFQCVLASLGLVQNLAALRALVGPGIQQGHMALHANALAMAAGAQGSEIEQVSRILQGRDKNLEAAAEILADIRGSRRSEESEEPEEGGTH
ncbi:hydroxymethylglutaryl-CoA reductase [Scardovia wiggsiae]|uniref:hydroxymethylglutaryl-CoA reductase n=1 Tax=Scardovia wiggsiae TaxID=230143 RepID=UPI00374F69DD